MSERDKTRVLMIRQTGVANARHIWTPANCLAEAGFAISMCIIEPDHVVPAGLAGSISRTSLDSVIGRGMAGLPGRLAAGWKLNRVLASTEYDILYVFDSWTLPALYAATGGRMRSGNRPVVYHTFDWLEPGLVNPIHILLERRMCRAADVVINTDRSRARLQRTMYRLARTPVTVQNSLPRSVADDAIPDPAIRSELAGGHPDPVLVIYPTVISNEASAQRMSDVAWVGCIDAVMRGA